MCYNEGDSRRVDSLPGSEEFLHFLDRRLEGIHSIIKLVTTDDDRQLYPCGHIEEILHQYRVYKRLEDVLVVQYSWTVDINVFPAEAQIKDRLSSHRSKTCSNRRVDDSFVVFEEPLIDFQQSCSQHLVRSIPCLLDDQRQIV